MKIILNKKIIISVCCLILLILNFSYTENAYALFGSNSEKHKISYPFPTDTKGFEETALKVTNSSVSNPIENFEITIPNNWIEDTSIKSLRNLDSSSILSKDLTSEITIYKSPLIQGDRATITIKRAQLFNEISAKYWLERYMNIQNYLPLGNIEENGNREASASFTYIDRNGFSKKARIRALINGNIIFLAEFDSPADFEKPLSFLEGEVLKSFKLTNISKDSIEKTKSIYMSNAVEINFPESWSIYKLDDSDLDNMVLQIHNLSESFDKNKNKITSLNGIIEVSAIKRTTGTNLMREVKLLKERLEESMDVHFDEVKETKTLNTDKKFIFSRYEAYIAKKNNDTKLNKEIHLAVLGSEDWYVIAFLYTPLQSEDSYNWARNIQSFKTIIESIN